MGTHTEPGAIVRPPRDAEAELAGGEAVARVVPTPGVSGPTPDRWRRPGGMRVDGARRRKDRRPRTPGRSGGRPSGPGPAGAPGGGPGDVPTAPAGRPVARPLTATLGVPHGWRVYRAWRRLGPKVPRAAREERRPGSPGGGRGRRWAAGHVRARDFARARAADGAALRWVWVVGEYARGCRALGGGRGPTGRRVTEVPDEYLESLTVLDVVRAEFDRLADYEYGYTLDPDAMLIDVDILGHIFEQAISDLEELRASVASGAIPAARTEPSKRRKHGVFYTPSFVTRSIVAETPRPVLR